MYANGGEEAEGYKQENGCVVGTPGWSCTSDADATTFFPPSADQNQSTSKYKHVLCSDFCSDVLGMWFMAGGHMGSLDVQADGVTSHVMQLPQSEKKKVVGARKTRRSVKGSGTSGNKDLMEVYRISRPSGSKDRHSKVATARGPRDRRMRLSVETAVKFFHVQDRLGFDQPSKAVEWLIDKCSAAIDELPQISHSEFLPFSTPMNGTAELLMNCERKRSRNPKLGSFSEQKTKAKEREQEGSKRRRRGQAKLSSEAETTKLGQGLLHMNSHDFTGIRTLESLHRAAYFNCAQYSPEIGFQSYPSSSSVQSADSTTTFSCPFPRVMPSISIDPQSTLSEF